MIVRDAREGGNQMLDIAFPEPEEPIFPCACKECECKQTVLDEGGICVLCSFGEHAEGE